MPIRPQHRWLYPIDWQQLTDLVRFERAKGRCKHCQRPHAKIVCHFGDGRRWDEDASTWRDVKGRIVRMGVPPAPEPGHAPVTRVYQATSNLDNNSGHNDFRNLKALCQRCHLMIDRPEHFRRRRLIF